MKILLLNDVERLGWLGDVVEVADGYARNYLLPQRIAVMPNEANMKSIAAEKVKRAEVRIAEQKHLEQAAEEVAGAEAVVAAKANEKGHLFGSVTAGDIAANLREQGFSVADEIVVLDEHIKEVGQREVKLKFSSDIVVAVNVVVVAKQDDIETEDQVTEDGQQITEDSRDDLDVEEKESV